MYKKTFVLFMLLSIVSCSTPAKYTDAEMKPYDDDTEYAVESFDKGYIVSITYGKFQFFPESAALSDACRTQLRSVVWDHSDHMGKEIKPINEQRIKLSVGRNELTGVTTCSAQIKVFYK
jgi:hypothetical protein